MSQKELIQKKYEDLSAQPSDINELLPYLNYYAKQSRHITEMGTRTPTSTYAFLAAGPDKLVSYDIFRSPAIDEVEALSPGNFTFVLQDVLEADIAETDFLFIDTYHTASQLELELARHAAKARKYIGFHDTYTFWEHGEPPYEGMDTKLACGRGLRYAIEPFINKGGWKIAMMTDKNNGLLILERDSISPALATLKYKSFFLLRKAVRKALSKLK